MALLCAICISSNGLIYNYIIMSKISLWAPFIFIGIYSAGFSSALTSILGAPRILYSVSNDHLIPWLNIFDQLDSKKNNEPIRAYWATLIISILCALFGDLNYVAPLTTQFFL